MATLRSELKVATPKESFDFLQSEPYNEVFTIKKAVDDTDGFTTLWNGSKSAGSAGYSDIKAMVIRNTSRLFCWM